MNCRTNVALVKYVALLAFQKMVHDHQYLVSLHQDVILSCLDDADISIRLRALDLLVNMVDSENMMAIVGKLMRQLHNSPVASSADDPVHDRTSHGGILPAADSDEEDPEESLRPAEQKSGQPPPLPEDYRVAVTKRILEMCLVQLVALAPVPTPEGSSVNEPQDEPRYTDVSRDIGLELLNVAVRVRDVRPEATRAAERLINDRRRSSSIKSNGFLNSAVWVIGEYVMYLNDAQDTLSTLLQPSTVLLPADILIVYLQAIPKVFLSISRAEYGEWTSERRSMTSMLVDSIVGFLDTATSHPHLEVQERAVELVELMRLVADSLSAQQESGAGDGVASTSAPLVITQVVPSLFAGMDLNPVAPAAQRKVPIPEGLDLDQPINESLAELLQSSAVMLVDDADTDESTVFYYRRPKPASAAAIAAEVVPAAKLLDQAQADSAPSYQQSLPYNDDSEATARRRAAERREKNRDDPFYIPMEGGSGVATPVGDIIRQSNGEEVDLDSIPIMDLSLEIRDGGRDSPRRGIAHPIPAPGRKRVAIIGDETIPFDNNVENKESMRPSSLGKSLEDHHRPGRGNRAKKALLQVDSSGLGGFSLDDGNNSSSGDAAAPQLRHHERRDGGDGGGGGQQQEEVDEEMLRALREVENRRLEIQRAAERVQVAKGVSEEGGTLIRKKVKKKKKKVRKEGEEKTKGKKVKAGDDEENEREREGGLQEQIEQSLDR